MRYIGGKYRIRKQLVDYLLDYITNTSCFIEPFVGSANITLSLFQDNPLFIPDKIIINDIHKDLILMWKALIYDGWEPPDKINKEEYELLRNAKPSALRGFCGYGCSFGGIWFSNFAKTEDGRNYCLNAKNSVVHVGDFLRWANKENGGVEIHNKSYNELDIPDGAVVYCDLPYIGTTKPGSGNEFDHDKFWQWVRELSNRCKVFSSEYIAPEDFKCVLEIPVSLDMGKKEGRIERLFKYNG